MNSEQNYFEGLSHALHEAGIAHPVLVVDKKRLDHNIDCLKKVIDTGFDYRIVAKSLPSIPMLQHIMARTQTNRLMCFHLPFLMHVIESLPNSDLLLGKPMTVEGLRQFYHWYDQQTTSFDPSHQLQWLVDSDKRLSDYERLAKELGVILPVNLEVDVGLHRGGYSDAREFEQSLNRIHASDSLRLTGLMGYEAHITKIPPFLGGPKKAEAVAKETYQGFVAQVEGVFGSSEDLCLNMGGSSTYPLYGDGDPCTEIATASALVKPSDFDVYTLESHKPAAFIATPILKRVDKPEVPMASLLSVAMRKVGVLPNQACFIYGGNWLANPCYPSDCKRVDMFGLSSNQEMYSLPDACPLREEDFMYFWPTQSEAVFLQFGQLVVYDEGKITERWPVFSYPQIQ